MEHTVEYSKCRKLINNADVLLFSHGGIFDVGWWVSRYTNSLYSHVGLAEWFYDRLMCIEFREFHGSRAYPVSEYLKEGKTIDVFRAAPNVEVPYLDFTDIQEIIIGSNKYQLTDEVIRQILDTSHSLLGRHYSWWTIWQLAKTSIPFIRLRQRCQKYDDKEPDAKKFVCSTLVSYAYRKHYLDPTPYLPDSYTTPGDIARSSLFVKLFRIISDL